MAIIEIIIEPPRMGRTIKRAKLVDEETGEHLDCKPGRRYIPEIHLYVCVFLTIYFITK
jgi:hypothetical protein